MVKLEIMALLPWAILAGTWIWQASRLATILQGVSKSVEDINKTFAEHEKRETEVHNLIIAKIGRLEGRLDGNGFDRSEA